jgi:hypothetical protein
MLYIHSYTILIIHFFTHYRANDEISMYQDHCVPVTHDTVEGAIKWLWSLDRLASVSNTACVEAVLRAIEDKQVWVSNLMYFIITLLRFFYRL